MCFDGKSDFTIGSITNGQNLIILGADMSFNGNNYIGNNDI